MLLASMAAARMNLLALAAERETPSTASLATDDVVAVAAVLRMLDSIADDWATTEAAVVAGSEVGMAELWSDESNRKLVVSERKSRNEESLSDRSEDEFLSRGIGFRTMQTIDRLRLMRSK